ncbi:hypothetical protein [Methylobacterium isbiliense]|uniref:Uncharacterized protein n=1 Tax=Methylobacterium isbiliense TaxID=315478 RepID=A0ABQ4SK74_9HYPH|nr:hypothetical protein [Methylobacterium isbiliense]MDN3625868.1 hypothetical protein [Methylobacterium isbiliense]GJE02818.1 hypothetical protein GMJLKIPL_4767 [Methylobacterium isbiliense]
MNINLPPDLASSFVFVRIDDATGEVTISDDGGQTFKNLHSVAQLDALFKPLLDVGQYDPLSMNTPQNKFVLRHIVEYYRPDLLQHRSFDRALNGYILQSQTEIKWRRAMQLKTSRYERWDCLAESLIDLLDSNP